MVLFTGLNQNCQAAYGHFEHSWVNGEEKANIKRVSSMTILSLTYSHSKFPRKVSSAIFILLNIT